MLPRKNRLKKSREFARIYKKGIKITVPHLRLFYLHAGIRESECRLGFVISKKQIRKIAARNRIKRILRAAATKSLKSIPSPLDIIIQGSAGIEKLSSKQVRQELEELFSKLKSKYDSHSSKTH